MKTTEGTNRKPKKWAYVAKMGIKAELVKFPIVPHVPSQSVFESV